MQPSVDHTECVVGVRAGDGVGSLRSTSRAGQWEDAHKKAGVVLQNRGYKGMGHSCSTTECKAVRGSISLIYIRAPHTVV